MLIGIMGSIGSGKSTVADYLVKNHGFIEYSFAKPLKQIAEILQFEHHQIYGTQDEKLEINKFWGISGREFLQKFGTEICRDTLPTIIPNMNMNNNTLWIRLFEKMYSPDKNIVISDVRFTDEINKIKELGGFIIKIERPSECTQKSDYQKHSSELSTSNIVPDYLILNNQTIEKLYENIDNFLY